MNFVRSLIARPILIASIAAGAATAVGLTFAPSTIPEGSRPLIAWDVFAAFYVVATNWTLRDDEPEKLARTAAATDQGRHFFLILCVLSAALSVWAVAHEFHDAKRDEGLAKTLHIAFAMGTVTLSWFFTHIVFALHYTHEFYEPDDDEKPSGGLKFPGDEETPNWWDFVHFALVIGVANQTADVQIERQEIRRTATWHGVVAFLFNTVIVAFTVNLAASQF
jgi:uncharacterized membrane protein